MYGRVGQDLDDMRLQTAVGTLGDICSKLWCLDISCHGDKSFAAQGRPQSQLLIKSVILSKPNFTLQRVRKLYPRSHRNVYIAKTTQHIESRCPDTLPVTSKAVFESRKGLPVASVTLVGLQAGCHQTSS